MRLLLAVTLLLAAGSVTACGGDDDPYASYCNEVKEQQPTLTEALSGGATTGLLQALPSFEALQAKSPADISEDWKLVVAQVSALKSALDAAHVDAASYDPDHPPSGLTQEQSEAIQTAAAGLEVPGLSGALSSVEQEARDVCKTPLTLG